MLHKNTTHGMSKTRFYRIWRNMLKRCDCKKYNSYHTYGGRGIRYEARWSNFLCFYEDMFTTYADNLSLDRIDVNGNYTKENCRWVTQKEQCKNKNSNIYIHWNGQKKIALDWALELGIKPKTLYQRLNAYKWSTEKALTYNYG